MELARRKQMKGVIAYIEYQVDCSSFGLRHAKVDSIPYAASISLNRSYHVRYNVTQRFVVSLADMVAPDKT
ncbi:hypothetical protein DPMN_157708 [Dreissena polymorpha]|uniref:Uncharacterized protein n=1 Tax=Dreissena polymorpha TaxID=45954 RepID=A0A9D4IP35_DREPO|nr:hypothetical protein DPMN_157708 [Dreissena polymorpha]